MSTNSLLPTGSPSRHAPLAGGLPSSDRACASVMKLEGTVSEGDCQSIGSYSAGPGAGPSQCYVRPGNACPYRSPMYPSGVGARFRHDGACGRQSDLQVGPQIGDVLDADRETHEAGSHSGGELLLRGELSVRGR